MSTPIRAAEKICEFVLRGIGDLDRTTIVIDLDDLPDELGPHAIRHQTSPTSLPYFNVPIVMLARYALGRPIPPL